MTIPLPDKPSQRIIQSFTTNRLLIIPATDKHFQEVQIIFLENRKTLLLLADNVDIQQEVKDYLNYEDLPPNGIPEKVRMFLLLKKEVRETVGFLAIYLGYPQEQTFYISSLFFRPFYQRKGYGQEVIKVIETQLLKEGYSQGRVAVGLKNWPALRFWSKQGYNQVTKISGDETYTVESFATIELCHCLI